MNKRMGGWMDGRIHELMFGVVDIWVDGRTDRSIC